MSFVVPLHQGAATFGACLTSILAQHHRGPMEVLVVDDGSSDAWLAIVERHAGDERVRVLRGARRGAAAAINLGVAAALYPFVAQIDQDVVLGAGWLERLLEVLEDPEVAAAQGLYQAPPASPFWVRVAGVDLWQRYGQDGRAVTLDVDHVCTGNTVYRRSALIEIGGFDPRFGYGYDNDLSYRLGAAGYRLVRRQDAPSLHYWPATFGGYLAQQYGQGYGRLELVAKHPRRVGGDDVSGALMMARGPLTGMALAALLVAMVVAAESGPWLVVSLVALGVLAALALERAIAGWRAYRATGDAVALAFPLVHLARDVCWASAIADWCARRTLRVPGEPRWSMPRGRRSAALQRPRVSPTADGARDRVLVLIPARNEAESLPFVLAELRQLGGRVDVLVVDDGSTDATPRVLAGLGVRHLRLPQHLGLGSAVRAGLRYGAWLGHRVVVRLDGDGQHDPAQIAALLAPIDRGECDAVRGSRYLGAGGGYRATGWRRAGQHLLASVLSRLTRRPVTDPTSGLWAFGPRAVELLADHHPTDYPEPELSLLLHRNGLTTSEVAVSMRPRRSGSSSFTLARGLLACARVLLAVTVVPWRSQVQGGVVD